MAFVVLLGATGATGLVLHGATGSAAVPVLLPIHLGTVAVYFLLLPFIKMVHRFYRFVTFIVDEQRCRQLAQGGHPLGHGSGIPHERRG